MTSTYDSEARSQEPHRRTQDSLDAVAESTLGSINRAATQASEKQQNSLCGGTEALDQS